MCALDRLDLVCTNGYNLEYNLIVDANRLDWIFYQIVTCVFHCISGEYFKRRDNEIVVMVGRASYGFDGYNKIFITL